MMKPPRWHELEFRHLEYAIAVKNHQGFMQAAIALGLDQGFLSKQIQRLEARLGFDLFDRSTRPLGLTAAGQAFLEGANYILTHTQRVVEIAQETHQGKWGRLDIGINTSIANSKLPVILKTFYNQFPNVSLVLHELASYDQIKELKNCQIDIGFFHKHNLQDLDPENNTTLKLTPILSETLLLVLPDHHQFARQSKVSLTKLSGERFILPPHTLLPSLRDQIDQICASARCKPVVVQEATWITTVLSLVAGGIGVSILPANVKHLQRSGVVYREIQESLPVLEIVAVTQSSNNSPVLRNFLKVIEDLCRV
jgi:DNA-binding transcriptional LysR family regulator